MEDFLEQDANAFAERCFEAFCGPLEATYKSVEASKIPRSFREKRDEMKFPEIDTKLIINIYEHSTFPRDRSMTMPDRGSKGRFLRKSKQRSHISITDLKEDRSSSCGKLPTVDETRSNSYEKRLHHQARGVSLPKLDNRQLSTENYKEPEMKGKLTESRGLSKSCKSCTELANEKRHCQNEQNPSSRQIHHIWRTPAKATDRNMNDDILKSSLRKLRIESHEEEKSCSLDDVLSGRKRKVYVTGQKNGNNSRGYSIDVPYRQNNSTTVNISMKESGNLKIVLQDR